MKLITAIIDPEVLDVVRDALRDAGVAGLTITAAQGSGRRGGEVKIYRGSEYVDDLRGGARVELVVGSREQAELVVNVLAVATRQAGSDFGKVWVGDVDWVVSLRTGEMNLDALGSGSSPPG